MLDRINQLLQAQATGRNILLALALTIVSMWLMAAIITPAFQEATRGLQPFDLNRGITADAMYRDLPAYTDRSRRLYVYFAIVDYVYPAAGAAFFALLWAWLFNIAPNAFNRRLTGAGILVFPFLFTLVDWLENAGFLYVIFQYPAEHPLIGTIASALKRFKPFLPAVFAALSLVFIVTTGWRRWRDAGSDNWR